MKLLTTLFFVLFLFNLKAQDEPIASICTYGVEFGVVEQFIRQVDRVLDDPENIHELALDPRKFTALLPKIWRAQILDDQESYDDLSVELREELEANALEGEELLKELTECRESYVFEVTMEKESYDDDLVVYGGEITFICSQSDAEYEELTCTYAFMFVKKELIIFQMIPE